MISPARRAAYEVVLAVDTGRQHLAAALAASRDGLSDVRDRALATDIAVGTQRWRGRIDHLIDQVSTRPTARLDPEVAAILRISAYQLFWLDRVPARAVVNDAVDLVREARKRSAAGMVNAVCRRLAGPRPPLPPPPTADASTAEWHTQALDYLSVTHSHPRWLVARWLERYGYTATTSWVTFNNTPAPITVWPAADGAAMRLEGLAGTPTAWVPGGLVLDAAQERGDALRSGGLYAQDEASAAVAALAAAVTTSPFLDACASPGGKTLALAATLPDAVQMVAADLRPARVALLSSTLGRLAGRAVPVVRADARVMPFHASIGTVLLDAPCTGLGTIRRDPDVKWRRTEADLTRYSQVQREMIDAALLAVRPGGTVVYATCSSEPEENEDLVRFGVAEGRWAVVHLDSAGGRLGLRRCSGQPRAASRGGEAFLPAPWTGSP
jgi:16S rRNA (cytosine967-C5)-methyltransferase